MRDGWARRAIKRAALWNFTLNLRATRWIRRRRGRAPYLLGGECRRCARCCEAPAIQVSRLVWYLPTLRRAFLAWQRVVNGFELEGRDAAQRVFVFRCTHFDRATRSCDSYASRPGICRDYPRALLEPPAADFFPECGYRRVARRSRELLVELRKRPLTAEQLHKLRDGLHLE